jgi:hypothetical protein
MQIATMVSRILGELQSFPAAAMAVMFALAALAPMPEKSGEIPPVAPCQVRFGQIPQDLRQHDGIGTGTLAELRPQPFRGRKPRSKPAPEKPIPAPEPIPSAG